MPAKEIPIIIGVGDIKNASTKVEDAKEPAQLMHEAIRFAIKDTRAPDPSKLQSSIDSIDVVATWTWPYSDLVALIAEKLDVKPIHVSYTEHGGNQPGRLLDEAAQRISQGKVKLAVITGGEALASRESLWVHKILSTAEKYNAPCWSNSSNAVKSVFSPTGRDLGNNLGAIHDIGNPIHVYPLYENAYRAHKGQSIKANNEESAKLYAEFSAIAARMPYAWNYGNKYDEKIIGTVSQKNRLICYPYPLLMNAFNNVNLAAACVITSVSFAKFLGVHQERWIYPLGGAGAEDAEAFWERPNYYTSPSINRSINSALEVSGISRDHIDLYDFYSCFPIVPKLAADHLGLPKLNGPKPLTLLGGLTSFGGAGNNYSMHALTEMTRAIRDGRGKNGLVLCNGGVLTKQHAVVLSKEPRKGGAYPEKDLQRDQIPDMPCPDLALQAEGEATVETYTVEFNRDGTPMRGYVVGRLKSDDKRFLANHGDHTTLMQMASGAVEIVGKAGWVRQDPERRGRGLFSFERVSKI